MSAKALLDHNPKPTEPEIRYALAGNLCRCTGYDKIVKAVVDAAKTLSDGAGSVRGKVPRQTASGATADMLAKGEEVK